MANELGVVPRSVYRWERGECLPHVSILQGLATLYGTTLDELLVELPRDGAGAATMGQRLAAFRSSLDLSQEVLAAELNISASALRVIEADRSKPDLATAFAIEKATQDWDEGPILAVDWLTPHDTQPNGVEQAGESQCETPAALNKQESSDE